MKSRPRRRCIVEGNPSCTCSAIACGARHSMAIMGSGDVYTWGW